MRSRAGLVAAGLVAAVGAAWLWADGRDEPTDPPVPAGAAPTVRESNPVVPGPVAGLTIPGLAAAWGRTAKTTTRRSDGQVSVSSGSPDSDVTLTVVSLPGDPDTPWGMSCARYGTPAPHDRKAVAALFGRCWPAGIDEPERAGVLAWLSDVTVSHQRTAHRFDGYSIVVAYDPPGGGEQGPSRAPGRDGSALRIFLTGGSGQPGLT
ncbi:hypothetical protein [Actinoplanes sp. CA-252034]|uniref:hypothetical protein n=1 Tax=Actinoplanes sp. CA-252034 TaxID=3239906 RepID=UPI003D978124